MTRHTFIPVLILSVALAVPAMVRAAQSPITADQVARTLSSVGMSTKQEQVILPTDIVATTNAPELKVVSTELWGDHQLKIRMSCVQPEECLPFFVTVRGSQPQIIPPLIAAHPSAAILSVKSGANSIVMHIGSRETLLLEGGHVHIQMSVVCLENGAVGQTIRVTSLNHKQTYLAEISSNYVLRGKLQ
jgi:hypothetical protein